MQGMGKPEAPEDDAAATARPSAYCLYKPIFRTMTP
jgi:hypothetical protein